VDTCYPIPVEKLVGTMYAGKKDMIILAPPSVCPVPFGEKPIYGSIHSPSVAHEFSKLGREYEWWHRLIKSAVDKAKHILNWDEVKLAPNGPFTILSPMNTDQLKEDSSPLQQAKKIIDLFKAPTNGADSSTDSSSQAKGADTNLSGLSSPRAALAAEDVMKLANAINSKSDSDSARDRSSLMRL
jgi:hypothetical protein